MMMNMFSSFDPSIMFMILPLNWIFLILPFFLIKNNFWILNFNLLTKINFFLFKEIYNNNFFMNKTLFNFFYSIFFMIMLNNLMNIIPNLFYISSNIMFTLFMSFYLILIYFSFYILNNNLIFFMNLTPKNTPLFLVTFINLIELNSFFIQIITLSMRLMINMMLGHIILNLINNYIMILIYMMIEIAIIFIQTYVFYILILLNSNNIY